MLPVVGKTLSIVAQCEPCSGHATALVATREGGLPNCSSDVQSCRGAVPVIVSVCCQDSRRHGAGIFQLTGAQDHHDTRMAASERLRANRIAESGGARDNVAPVAR